MPSKPIDAHVYHPCSRRAVKRRLSSKEDVVALHEVSADRTIPGSSVVLLVSSGEVSSCFALTAKGPVRLSAVEADSLIQERDAARRTRLLGEIVRGSARR